MKSITRKDEIKYLRMALALNGVSTSDYVAELILENLEAIHKKGGQFSIRDSVNIEMRIRSKYRKVEAVNIPPKPQKQKK